MFGLPPKFGFWAEPVLFFLLSPVLLILGALDAVSPRTPVLQQLHIHAFAALPIGLTGSALALWAAVLLWWRRPHANSVKELSLAFLFALAPAGQPDALSPFLIWFSGISVLGCLISGLWTLPRGLRAWRELKRAEVGR
jgi:hypothetical protein